MIVLKFEAAFTSRLGKCLDASVITIVATIKLDRLDTGSRRLLGNRLTNLCSRIAVTAVTDSAAKPLVTGAGTHERLAGQIVDQLTAEMLE